MRQIVALVNYLHRTEVARGSWKRDAATAGRLSLDPGIVSGRSLPGPGSPVVTGGSWRLPRMASTVTLADRPAGGMG